MTTGTGDELDLLGLDETHARLVYGELSSAELLARCTARIAAHDGHLGAVIALDPTAPQQAAAADRRHAAGADHGPLDGIPVLVKDCIDTAGLATTCGSRLLARGPAPARDAEVVARLRAGGAVILGKANLSEWSNFRSARATEGWSAAGGQAWNPYRPGYSPWGSSAGSAVAVAAGLAPLALGAETDGSIVGPAGVCGVVGLKPEAGLVPLRGVAGITALDCVGPLASSVADAAVCAAVLAGQPGLAGLRPPVARARLGAWLPPGTPAAVASVLAALSGPGLTLADADLEVPEEAAADGMFAMLSEFRPRIEEYLRERGHAGLATLADIIAGNAADPQELALFGQDLLEKAAAMPARPERAARAARERSRAQAREVLADALDRHGVQAIVAPSAGPAWPVDYARGDAGRLASSTLAALAGYPSISVPAGLAGGLPVGVSVFGPPTLARLLPLALLVERACGPRPWPPLAAGE
ncbi:MAG TPA: amidase family protein [Trebonia sp.]|nr:amidase family protein [Trebonia sp.]